MSSTADLTMVNAYIPGRADVSRETPSKIERRDRLLGPAYRLMYERPLEIVRGEGAWLYGPDGRGYLDIYNNVTSLGHCHPAVVEAVQKQVATLATNTRRGWIPRRPFLNTDSVSRVIAPKSMIDVPHTTAHEAPWICR